ncbi:MAG: hypothetical protein EBV10_05120, partial [Synechococcaceae bacterium WB6_1A_059]|nr:hypothetical protein [Synechococcaceae bacterium WB6_1A_059]
LKQALDRWELERLLSGTYDQEGAVISINAGAGALLNQQRQRQSWTWPRRSVSSDKSRLKSVRSSTWVKNF